MTIHVFPTWQLDKASCPLWAVAGGRAGMGCRHLAHPHLLVCQSLVQSPPSWLRDQGYRVAFSEERKLLSSSPTVLLYNPCNPLHVYRILSIRANFTYIVMI